MTTDRILDAEELHRCLRAGWNQNVQSVIASHEALRAALTAAEERWADENRRLGGAHEALSREQHARTQAEAEVSRLREALTFYAGDAECKGALLRARLLVDSGEVARAALAPPVPQEPVR